MQPLYTTYIRAIERAQNRIILLRYMLKDKKGLHHEALFYVRVTYFPVIGSNTDCTAPVPTSTAPFAA